MGRCEEEEMRGEERGGEEEEVTQDFHTRGCPTFSNGFHRVQAFPKNSASLSETKTQMIRGEERDVFLSSGN